MPSTASAISEMARSSRILLTTRQKSTTKSKKFGERKRVTAPPRPLGPRSLDASTCFANRLKWVRNPPGPPTLKTYVLMILTPYEVYSSKDSYNQDIVSAQCQSRGGAIRGYTARTPRARRSFSASACPHATSNNILGQGAYFLDVMCYLR
jgi:hypothetical protein